MRHASPGSCLPGEEVVIRRVIRWFGLEGLLDAAVNDERGSLEGMGRRGQTGHPLARDALERRSLLPRRGTSDGTFDSINSRIED